MSPRPLSPQTIASIRELRYTDGLTIMQTAQLVGCGHISVKRYAPGRPGKVPNDKLRATFEQSGVSAHEIALRLGWTCAPGRSPTKRVTPGGDGSRVKRTLGLLPDVNGGGRRSTRTMIDAETAGLIAEALGLAAWEVMPDEDAQAA